MNDKLSSAMRGFEAVAADAKAISKDFSAFSRIVSSLSKATGYDDLKRIEKWLTQLRGTLLDPSGLAERVSTPIEDAGKWLEAEWERRSTRFAAELAEYLRERRIEASTLDQEVRAWPFVIQIEGRLDRAQVTFAGEPVGKPRPLSAPIIYKAVEEAKAELKRNETPPHVFVEELVDAFHEVARANGGRRQRLPDVHFQIFVRRQTASVRNDPRSGRVKTYPRYQFAWDLGLAHDAPERLEDHQVELFEATESARGRSDSITIAPREGPAVVLGNILVSAKRDTVPARPIAGGVS